MTTEKEQLLHDISLLHEWLDAKDPEKALTVWNGMQILDLLKDTILLIIINEGTKAK